MHETLSARLVRKILQVIQGRKMQLSFSIDAILGNKMPEEKSDIGHGSRERNRRKTTDVADSPRSHTIKWKPPSTHSPKVYKPHHHNESDGKTVLDRMKSILRSPPNAKVVPNFGQREDALFPDNSIHHHKRPYSSPTKTNSIKSLPTRLADSRFLPYPTELIRSYSVHHHPHHYPYQLPFIRHEGMTSKSYPGVFSPHYPLHGRVDKRNLFQPRLIIDDSRGNLRRSKSPIVHSSTDEKADPENARSQSNQRESDVASPERKPVSEDRASQKQNSSDSEQLSENDQQTSEKKKKRMGRRLFTGFQILELEKAFSVKPYLNRMERAFISQKVNLTECQIKTWFQNRRTKEKRRGLGLEEEDGVADGLFSKSIVNYHAKASHIPGYGIQLAPTYGPPDHHLQAAIVNYMNRRKSSESSKTHS